MDEANVILPVKDDDSALPVPSAWRATLTRIVDTLARGDIEALGSIEPLVPVDTDTIEQVRAYIEDYGETLVNLPDAAWRTSVSQHLGSRWMVLVDLWTAESGRSDMVLEVEVTESEPGYLFKVRLVYVP